MSCVVSLFITFPDSVCDKLRNLFKSLVTNTEDFGKGNPSSGSGLRGHYQLSISDACQAGNDSMVFYVI